MLRDVRTVNAKKDVKENTETVLSITYKKKEYRIRLDKIVYVLERLKGEKIKTKDIDEIKKMMKYYRLDKDDIFLESINELKF